MWILNKKNCDSLYLLSLPALLEALLAPPHPETDMEKWKFCKALLISNNNHSKCSLIKCSHTLGDSVMRTKKSALRLLGISPLSHLTAPNVMFCRSTHLLRGSQSRRKCAYSKNKLGNFTTLLFTFNQKKAILSAN